MFIHILLPQKSFKLFISFLILFIPAFVHAQTTYKVITQKLNVRATPSSQGKLMGTLKEGTIVEVKEITNGWATILFSGKECHVSANYLEKCENSRPKEESQQLTPTILPDNKSEEVSSPIIPSPNIKGHNGIDFSFSIGYDFGLEDNSYGSIPIEAEIGKRFTKNIYWGGGAGLTLPAKSGGDILVPITTNIKFFFPSSKGSIVPLFMFRVGYGFNTSNSKYSSINLQLMPGLQFPLSNRIDMNVMAGYGRTIMTSGGEGSNMLGVKLGMTLHRNESNKVKKILPSSEEHCFQVGIEPRGFISSGMQGVGYSVLGTYKYDRQTSIGVGYGFGGYDNDDEFTQHRIFVRGQYRKSDLLWSPFYACDLGFYTNNYTSGMYSDDRKKTGFFITPTIGMSLRPSANSYLDFGLGVELATKTGKYDKNNYEHKSGSMNMSGFIFRINFTRTLNKYKKKLF